MNNYREKKPHICFVAPKCFPVLSNSKEIQIVGGAEVQQSIIGKALTNKGYKISMICLDYGQEDMCNIEGVTILKAHKPNEGIPVLRFIHPRATSLWSAMKQANADIYYQRCGGMLTGLVGLFCKLYKKKMIYSASNDIDFIPGKQRIRFKRDLLLYEWGVRHSDVVVSQSIRQQRLCRRNYLKESIIIPNCFNAPMDNMPKHIDSLWVSTIRPHKRPDIFLEMARVLPNYNFCMIGGAGSDKKEKQLYDKIKTAAEGIENLTFIGFVPFSEIDQYFNQARVFINTSEYEGFPNTFLQSWARGIPTISFFDPEIKFNDKPVNYVASSFDDLINHMNILLHDREIWKNASDLCKHYFAKHHSVEHVLPKYINLFNQIYD